MNKSIFYTLFCVIIIDALGMALPFPVLGPLLVSVHSPMLAANTSLQAREVLYSLVMASFVFGMFIGCPILGDLSDHIGRKKGIVLCLLGVALGGVISALGVIIHSVALLIFGRFFAGFASGSQPIAQAAIIDISTPEDRTINLSRIVLAITLGIIVGPIIGGFSGNSYFINHFGFSLAFWLSAAFALANAFAVYRIFQDTGAKRESGSISFFRSFLSFLAAFKNSSVAFLSLGFLLYEVAWSLYFAGIALFLFNIYHYSAMNLGLFTAFIGVGASLGMTSGIRVIMRYFKKDKESLVLSLILMAIFFFFVAFSASVLAQWICGFFLGLFVSVAYTNFLSLYSLHASETHQGWIMGVATSVGTFAWVVTNIFSGQLAYIAVRLPFWLATVATVLALLMFWIYNRKPLKKIM